MPNPSDTRDRVRALVREILATVPTEPEDAPNDKPPEHVVVNSLKDTLNKEWDRDESAKQLITEDDLRGLSDGAKVRIAENASLGTDHGKASTAMVLGSGVKGGMCYGGAPDLSNLDDGDLRTKTDFRSVYATIIRDWFGHDPLPVLNHDYENLGFIERASGRRRGVRH